MSTMNNKAGVIVAMSGGVDSSVAAALLCEKGYDVVGMTLRVASGDGRESSQRACCTLDAAEDARRVADRLGIPHYVVNYVGRFEREVIADFTSEYLAGRTPNPCVRCNQRVKFGALFEKAAAAGAESIATGHYVQLTRPNGRFALRRAVDRAKDQSYALAGLSQEQLRRALFPLGGLTKEQARAKARSLGLVTADKPESQEICFIPDDDYRHFLEQRVGPATPGPILSAEGEALGEHKGLMYYTVGQRKGLGIAAARPYYVIRLDLRRNALIVGHEEATHCVSLTTGPVVWGALSPQTEAFDCLVQVRYRHTPAPGTAEPGERGLKVRFHRPQRAVTPGQWAVLYNEDETVLGAGIIDDFETCAAAVS